MLAAWGLGGSPALAAAAAAAAATRTAGDTAAAAASTPRAAAAGSPAGSSHQQQQQHEQLAAAHASAAAQQVALTWSKLHQRRRLARCQAAMAAPFSSCAMLDALPAAEQMQRQGPLPKPFSMSDLNALDIPGQIANDLGDLSGLPFPSDANAGSTQPPPPRSQQQQQQGQRLAARWRVVRRVAAACRRGLARVAVAAVRLVEAAAGQRSSRLLACLLASRWPTWASWTW
ncbi:hypothetical protein COO60DRAFT_1240597 [Scenedesmus sp. NREL 46B-D3]|nr:hypothetical protein COO60DRAFT_1240597 [Scenedesmus sp. NREL 46B-D3]